MQIVKAHETFLTERDLQRGARSGQPFTLRLAPGLRASIHAVGSSSPGVGFNYGASGHSAVDCVFDVELNTLTIYENARIADQAARLYTFITLPQGSHVYADDLRGQLSVRQVHGVVTATNVRSNVDVSNASMVDITTAESTDDLNIALNVVGSARLELRDRARTTVSASDIRELELLAPHGLEAAQLDKVRETLTIITGGPATIRATDLHVTTASLAGTNIDLTGTGLMRSVRLDVENSRVVLNGVVGEVAGSAADTTVRLMGHLPASTEQITVVPIGSTTVTLQPQSLTFDDVVQLAEMVPPRYAVRKDTRQRVADIATAVAAMAEPAPGWGIPGGPGQYVTNGERNRTNEAAVKDGSTFTLFVGADLAERALAEIRDQFRTAPVMLVAGREVNAMEYEGPARRFAPLIHGRATQRDLEGYISAVVPPAMRSSVQMLFGGGAHDFVDHLSQPLFQASHRRLITALRDYETAIHTADVVRDYQTRSDQLRVARDRAEIVDETLLRLGTTAAFYSESPMALSVIQSIREQPSMKPDQVADAIREAGVYVAIHELTDGAYLNAGLKQEDLEGIRDSLPARREQIAADLMEFVNAGRSARRVGPCQSIDELWEQTDPTAAGVLAPVFAGAIAL